MSMCRPVGLARLRAAGRHSLRGLRDTFDSEAAFRQEVLYAACVAPLACVLPIDATTRVLLLLTLGLILVVELLNTAIEAAIDRIGPDWHALSGKAKDAGSAAVAVCLALHALVWLSLAW